MKPRTPLAGVSLTFGLVCAAACTTGTLPRTDAADGTGASAAAPKSASGAQPPVVTPATVTSNAGTFCVIQGVRVPAHAPNPVAPCFACFPEVSLTAWTLLPDGSICGPNLACAAGSCVPLSGGPGGACIIGGNVYGRGAEDPGDVCLVCDPTRSTTNWTATLDGKPCPGGSCVAGTCAILPTCTIDGVLYEEGDWNPKNPCEVCDATHPTAWSKAADGAACGGGQACFGGTCTSDFPDCTIDGKAWAPGDRSPEDACVECDPRQSLTTWSSVPDGTSCPGGACFTGKCD
jgi:hypothetical protein